MDLLQQYLSALEAEMRRLVISGYEGPPFLYDMLRYHLGWVDQNFHPTEGHRGKRLRPLICLLVTEAQGGNWRQALPAAAAIELLHNFTLIHDDIEDRDERRRGRPTLWALWGIPQAINAGDALFAISYRGLVALGQHGIPAPRVLEATERYTEAVVQLTEGQCYDLMFEAEGNVDEDSYLRMTEGKTSALIALAAELGGIIAGAPASSKAALHTYGVALGKAFQMQDDLLGLWGDPEKTGKPVGSDLLKRKKTLPILHGLRTSESLRQLLLGDTFSEADVDRALSELDRVGSRAYTESLAYEYSQQAMAALTQSGGSGLAYEALRALTMRLTGRQQ